jgi:hypothetical protein
MAHPQAVAMELPSARASERASERDEHGKHVHTTGGGVVAGLAGARGGRWAGWDRRDEREDKREGPEGLRTEPGKYRDRGEKEAVPILLW